MPDTSQMKKLCWKSADTEKAGDWEVIDRAPESCVLVFVTFSTFKDLNFWENVHHVSKVLLLGAEQTAGVTTFFSSGRSSRFLNEGEQSPRKKFSEQLFTELSLKSRVSQNRENPKEGLLVTWENWRCLKNFCRFSRFEFPAESVELEDEDEGVEDELDDEDEDPSPWSPGGEGDLILIVRWTGRVILTCFLTLIVQLLQEPAILRFLGRGQD